MKNVKWWVCDSLVYLFFFRNLTAKLLQHQKHSQRDIKQRKEEREREGRKERISGHKVCNYIL